MNAPAVPVSLKIVSTTAHPSAAEPPIAADNRGDSPFESLAECWAYYMDMSRKRNARLLAELGKASSDDMAMAA